MTKEEREGLLQAAHRSAEMSTARQTPDAMAALAARSIAFSLLALYELFDGIHQELNEIITSLPIEHPMKKSSH